MKVTLTIYCGYPSVTRIITSKLGSTAPTMSAAVPFNEWVRCAQSDRDRTPSFPLQIWEDRRRNDLRPPSASRAGTLVLSSKGMFNCRAQHFCPIADTE